MSLLQFKSVCKSWYALIESSTFVDQHVLHHNNSKDTGDKLIAKKPYPWRSRDGEFILLSGDKYNMSSVNVYFDQYNWHPISDLFLINSCNGIICLQLSHKYLALWNPATKQFRTLPEYLVTRQSDVEQISFTSAFGFDEKNNDYKVVKFTTVYKGMKLEILTRYVEVYSLSTDSWRITHRDVVLPIDGVYMYPALRNGMCFWIGDNPQSIYSLVYFDFNDEVIGTIPLPDACKLDRSSCDFIACSIRFLSDKLAFTYATCEDYDQDYCTKHFEIWVLDDYNVKESWTKRYTAVSTSTFVPKALSKNGEFLFVIKGPNFENYNYRDPTPFPPSHFCLYDLVTQEMIDLNVQVHGSDFEFVFYNESLVSIE